MTCPGRILVARSRTHPPPTSPTLRAPAGNGFIGSGHSESAPHRQTSRYKAERSLLRVRLKTWETFQPLPFQYSNPFQSKQLIDSLERRCIFLAAVFKGG